MVGFDQVREEALLALRRERSPEARVAAAQNLWRLAETHPARAQELAETLPTLLTDAQSAVRRVGVALSAQALSEAEAQEVLERLLRDPEPEVRLEAVGRLGDLGRSEARGALANALGDVAFEVRFEAARGIAELGHRAGLEVLILALDRAELRFRAINALAVLGAVEAVPALQRLMRRFLTPVFDRTQAAGALAKLGNAEGAAFLLGRTKSRWTPDRALALELCGEVQVEGAFARLSEVLGATGDLCRGAAARGLGRLRDPRAMPLLAAMFEDATLKEDVRLDAAEGLCRLGLPDARAVVARAATVWPAGEGREELLEMLAQDEA